MNAPTEPGWYYQQPERIVEVVRARDDGDGCLSYDERGDTLAVWAERFDGDRYMAIPDYLAHHCAGEFGPRIPSPERLAALEELARRDPIHETKHSRICHFCGGTPEKHYPDCPWLRAQPTPKE